MNVINVTKRDGRTEELNIDKIHQVVDWACEGIKGVSVSEIVINSKMKFYNNMPTREIHQSLLDTTEELISVEHPNYDKVASRLYNFDLRKRVFGSFQLPENYAEIFKSYVVQGLYDRELIEVDDELINACWSKVNQEYDYDITLYGMKQIEKKYCVQSRVTGKVYETPSMAFFRIALVGALNKNGDVLKDFTTYYRQFAGGENSLPSPIMGGVGTPVRQYSSCTGIDVGDSIDSITSAASAVVKYITQRAGIGLNIGRIRAVHEPIRTGEVSHTGMIPFIKMFQGSVHSCSQGGMRKSAATAYFPIWHYEFPEMVVLKDNTLTEENSARHLDYGVTVNGYMYNRLLTGGQISLFSPNVAGGELYEAYAKDQERFAELYEELEANPAIRRRTISAEEIFTRMLMIQRKETGRIYLANIDHMNTHGAFDEKVAPIHFSNLCLEICLPSKPIQHIDDSADSEIFLCTLANVNMTKIKTLSDLERVCYNTVRFLDDLLDYQRYPVEAAGHWGRKRRSLGVGVNNYAHWLARKGLKYGEKAALEATHDWFEAFQYYLIKASVEVAKEKGVCESFNETKYAQGILPIDTYKRDVDELGDFSLKLDWEWLRNEVLTHGMRNSTLTALPPSETSANVLPGGSTNGIEPPRNLLVIKSNKDLSGKVLVPEVARLKNKYDLLWNHPSPEGYIKTVAVIQKFVDQSISANASYDPANYPDNETPMSQMMRDVLIAYKYGVKTLYYHNTRKETSIRRDEIKNKQPASVNVNEDAEDCDACSV